MSGSQLLRQIITGIHPRLLAFTDEQAGSHLPGKWSSKQIIGHLIDSASNNHGRFVRAQQMDTLVFTGYDQEFWVETQNYQDAPWTELVELWAGFNLHIARIVSQIPDAILDQPRSEHNLNVLAWKAVPLDQPATLRYFIHDYIGHLENHLRQVFPEYVPISF